MNEKEAKIYRDGFDAGVKATEYRNSKAIKIGNAILDVCYDTFQTREEDD